VTTVAVAMSFSFQAPSSPPYALLTQCRFDALTNGLKQVVRHQLANRRFHPVRVKLRKPRNEHMSAGLERRARNLGGGLRDWDVGQIWRHRKGQCERGSLRSRSVGERVIPIQCPYCYPKGQYQSDICRCSVSVVSR